MIEPGDPHPKTMEFGAGASHAGSSRLSVTDVSHRSSLNSIQTMLEHVIDQLKAAQKQLFQFLDEVQSKLRNSAMIFQSLAAENLQQDVQEMIYSAEESVKAEMTWLDLSMRDTLAQVSESVGHKLEEILAEVQELADKFGKDMNKKPLDKTDTSLRDVTVTDIIAYTPGQVLSVDTGLKNTFYQLKAKEIRDKQDDYEQELTFGGEPDLFHCFDTCDKNPGHLQFIPVGKFTKDCLPICYQGDSQLVELAKAQADLTCCIRVHYVSLNRPKNFPDTETPFPYHDYCGRYDMCRSGTGWVYDVMMYTEDKGERGYLPCECTTCEQSEEPRSQWANVWIWTAKSLVYDKEEAVHSNCYLFYDSNEQKLSDCPVLTGDINGVESIPGTDLHKIYYITHDVALAGRLKAMCDCYGRHCMELRVQYNPQLEETYRQRDDKDTDNDGEYFNPGHKLCIITSHPHGLSKMVSVGEVTRRQRESNSDTAKCRYFYTTPTCPGSCGAPVYVLGRRMDGWAYHPHSGRDSDVGVGQLNKSGIAFY